MPEAKRVVEYLIDNPHIWAGARISASSSHFGIKRAPIFGIPFKSGLKEALSSNSSFNKAMYQRPDWKIIEGHAVVGSLLAHTSSSEDLVEFEAWQLLDATTETFYIHAIFDRRAAELIHLDGATMHHSNEEKSLIVIHGSKIKGSHYTKHFRLDGNFSIKVAEDIMDLYLPLDDLTEEFLQSIR